MRFVVDLSSPTEDIHFVTQRHASDRLRSRSITLGRSVEPATIGPCPDEVIDLDFDNSAKVGYILSQGEYALTGVRAGHEFLRRGDCIEIQNILVGIYKVSFLVIELITQDCDGVISIRGLPLARSRDLLGKLPPKSYEVCRILQYDNCEPCPALLSVNLGAVIAKRNLVMTNALYPRHSGNGNVVCRWDFKMYTITTGRASKPVEEALERVDANDVGLGHYRESDDVLCQVWRGGRKAGGSWRGDTIKAAFPVGTIELDGNPNNSPNVHRLPGQKYTVFDSFSGAGGVSRGAQMSGFKVTHAVDKAADVWDTYHTNFQSTQLYRCSVDEFIVRARKEHIRVDILHLSPPCQFFSPAHTHQAAHDDENIFALFSCNALINKVRPRLITVEQTFGITHDRHQEYLRGLINDFTQFGYSVRWKIVRLCTWGSAQDRKRLIMIAAAPGEKLPPFPKPTHSETGRRGMKPFTTMRKALSGVRRGDDLHDLDTVRRFRPHRPAYNPDCLSGTITTGGADFVYYDGSRDFTLREFATLQGFPRYHRFRGTKTSVKKQIGNAFPPNTVKVLYQHLQSWLLEHDGVLPHQAPTEDAIMIDQEAVGVAVGPVPNESIIIVDDSDESSGRNRSATQSATPEMIDLVGDSMDLDEATPRNSRPRNDRSVDSVMIDLT